MPEGHARDMCFYAALLADGEPGRDDAAQAIRSIQAIRDPIIRDAAVTGWLTAHPDIAPTAGDTLCALLDPTEAQACRRRLRAPHLNRRP